MPYFRKSNKYQSQNANKMNTLLNPALVFPLILTVAMLFIFVTLVKEIAINKRKGKNIDDLLFFAVLTLLFAVVGAIFSVLVIIQALS